MKRAALALLPLLLLGVTDARAGTSRHSIHAGGLPRTYLLHVPASSPPGKRLPVVFVLHGAGCEAESMVRATGLNAIADREGFLVVYPQAYGRARTFNAGAAGAAAARGRPDDVGFVRALLQALRRSYAVDEKRVYATGFSNGGMLCYRLAAEMSGELAAIAPVAAGMGSAVTTRPSSSVSVCHVHGDRDRRVPYSGAGGRRPRYRSVPASLSTWAAYNGCAREPTVTRMQVAEDLRVVKRQHACPRAGVGVVGYVVEGAAHVWPANGQAWVTRTIWAFFRGHPKSAR